MLHFAMKKLNEEDEQGMNTQRPSKKSIMVPKTKNTI